MTEHEHWDELAAGYALHALSAEDEQSFITHLAGCDACAASVNDLEMVAAQLGSISHYREDDDQAPSWESIRSAIVGVHLDELASEPAVIDLTARRRRYELSRRSLAAAAAVVLVAGAGVATWHVATGGSSNSCSAASGCHVVQLDAAGKTLGSLTVRNNTVSVTPTHMPAAPAGKEYVLWQLPRDAKATPISEFEVGTGKPATGTLRAAYTDTTGFAISLETAGVPPTTPSNTLASGLAS